MEFPAIPGDWRRARADGEAAARSETPVPHQMCRNSSTAPASTSNRTKTLLKVAYGRKNSIRVQIVVIVMTGGNLLEWK